MGPHSEVLTIRNYLESCNRIITSTPASVSLLMKINCSRDLQEIFLKRRLKHGNRLI